MFVIKYKKIFFLISVVTILTSIFSVIYFGLNFGIDFKGGSLLEVRFENEVPSFDELQSVLNQEKIGQFNLRSSGENSFMLRTIPLDESQKANLLKNMSMEGRFEPIEERFNSIGPSVGDELKDKAVIAIIITLIVIILFVAFAFRTVSKPVSSWMYGLVSVFALAHDIIIPVGIFAFLGYSIGAEIDSLFVMALLAILGYSVNDTIIVFDRIRENLKLNQEIHNKEQFDVTVGKSLNQTFARSINTSFTTFVVLVALFILGGEATKNFTLVLMTGIIAGTYSSIFLASPLLVFIQERKDRKLEKAQN